MPCSATPDERFAETVQGMKQMAAEMQRELETTRLEMHRELEATRDELRRGMFELPQETAESAAQMRRVIVDQIEALAELNRIVARHGRNLDAVEPRRVGARGSHADGHRLRQPRAARRRPAPRARRRRRLRAAARRADAAAQPSATPPAATAPAGSPICSTAPREAKRRASCRAKPRASGA